MNKTWKTPKGTELQIMNIKGKDYLQVQWRILWFREDKNDWSIETEIQEKENNGCLAKATIRDASGRIIATAHKFEDAKGFADYREKAETGAIGRAVALLGYGTQFCANELDEGERLADSPVGKENPYAMSNMQPEEGDGFPNTDSEYRIPFGKYKNRKLSEIGYDDLRGYVIYLENASANSNKPMRPEAHEFIERASDHIAHFENQDVK